MWEICAISHVRKRRGSLPPVAQRGSSTPFFPQAIKPRLGGKSFPVFLLLLPPPLPFSPPTFEKKKRDPSSFPPRERLYQYGQRSFVRPTTSPFPLIPRFRVPSPDLGGAERRRRIFKKDFSCGRGRQKKRTYEGIGRFVRRPRRFARFYRDKRQVCLVSRVISAVAAPTKYPIKRCLFLLRLLPPSALLEHN